jgi:hypothetical protein
MESDKERIERLEEAYRKLWVEHEDLKNRIKENYQEFKVLRESYGIPAIEIKPENKSVSPAAGPALSHIHEEKKPALPKKNTEWEKFIGEQLLSKIGLLVLLVGLVIGTKYAIDHNWLSVGLRIGGSYVIALALGFFAYRFRDKYRGFSAVLASGAVSISYFITYAAFSWYQVIPFGVSFGGLLVCAAIAVYLAMYYNLVIIAHFGLIAAYVLPPLISTSNQHLSNYLAYMLVINTGMLVISLLKNWKSIRVPILIWSNLIFIFWFTKDYHEATDWKVAAVYVLLYFFMFHVSAILPSIRRKELLPITSFGEILPISMVSFGILRYILYAAGTSLTINILFTVLLLAYFTGAVLIGIRRKDTVMRDVNVLTIIGVLAISIILDAGPGYRLALGMVIFGVLFTAQIRYKLKQFDVPVLIGLLACFIYYIVLQFGPSRIIDKHDLFLAGLFASAVLIALCAFNYRSTDQTTDAQKLLPYLTFGTLLFTFSGQIFRVFQYNAFEFLQANPDMERLEGLRAVSIYGLSFLASLSLIGGLFAGLYFAFLAVKKYLIKVPFSIKASNLFIVSGFICLLYFSVLSWFAMGWFQDFIFGFGSYVLGRYVAFIAVLLVYYFLFREDQKQKNLLVWFNLSLLWILSLELSQWSIISGFGAGYKIVLTLLWVSFSVGMIYRGLVKNSALLRITAMVILGVSMLKLFFFDLTRLSTITKVVVFMLVGALLLVGAYFYQRLAKSEQLEEEGKTD